MPKKLNRNRIIVLLGLLLLGIGLHLGIDGLHGATVDADLKFKWTMSGDDGMMGQASVYSLRFAEDPDSLVNLWNQTTEAAGGGVFTLPGQLDSVMVTLPLETGRDYYFGVKVGDEVPNWSGLSNVVVVNIPDSLTPSQVTDLQYEVIGVN